MSEVVIIWPTESDYLKRAQAARAEASNALSAAMKEQFLKMAEEWERLAKAAAASYWAARMSMD